MKTLIIYDSYYGNTAEIAYAIERELSKLGDVFMLRAANAMLEDLNVSNFDLLIVGSPTRNFRPTQPIMEFLNSLPSKSLKNTMVAAFDTRQGLDYINSKMLRFIVKTGGYAAKIIQQKLQKKSGNTIAECEGFIVTNQKGPLAENEINRAILWAQLISKRANQNQSLMLDLIEKIM